MNTEWAFQYNKPSVLINDGDSAEEVIEFAQIEGCMLEEGPDDWDYVVSFPGRPPELYSEEALSRSLTDEAWERRRTRQAAEKT